VKSHSGCPLSKRIGGDGLACCCSFLWQSRQWGPEKPAWTSTERKLASKTLTLTRKSN